MKRRVSLYVVVLMMAITSCNPEPDDNITIKENDEQVNAFINVNVITMTDEAILENQTVIISGNKITEIGSTGEINIAEEINVYDGSDKYLMPGLADMHMHTLDDWKTNRWPVNPFHLFIANGVTTVRDFGPHGDNLNYSNTWKNEIREGTQEGPIMYNCGVRPGRPWETNGFQNYNEMLLWNKNNNFDFLKVYSYLSKNEFQDVMANARQLDMYVVGHIPNSVGLNTVANEGYNEIAHIEELLYEFIDYNKDTNLTYDEWSNYLFKCAFEQFPDITTGFNETNFKSQYADKLQNIIQTIKSNNISVNTTIYLDEIVKQKLFSPATFLSINETQYLPQDYIYSFNNGEDKHQLQLAGQEFLFSYKYGIDMLLLTELHNAGVNLLLGSDAGTATMGIVPGFSIHNELKTLVDNGFTPHEALLTGTVNAAKVMDDMNGEGNFGTIEIGNRADLILLEANPLEDISNTKSIIGVMANGKWYSKSEIDDILN
jgi:Amidohydrolase family